ncbi:MAG TPA: PA2779 family protein [Pseudomonadales bacterium]|nr:PA2779 family protein [Pseudomonadales bacterium]
MRKKLVAIALSGSLVCAGFSTGVAAAVIDTQQAVTMDAREQRIAAVSATLAREDVRSAMIELGVEPQQAQLRVASLSDAELARLEGQLQQLPAGGSALGLVGAVFLVLLILEITGVIDIFKKL